MRPPLGRAAVAVASMAALPAALAMPAAATTAGPAFAHGVLPPPPAGSTSKNNQAAEPQIRADQAGNFYISSENGLGSGTDAWSSGWGAHLPLIAAAERGILHLGGHDGFRPRRW